MPDLDRIHIVIENLPDARAQVSVNIPTPRPGMRIGTPAHSLALDALGWLGKQPAVAGFVYAPSLNIKCDDEQTLLAAYGTLQALGCHAAAAAVLRAMDAATQAAGSLASTVQQEEQVQRMQRWAEIGKAMERACANLPEGTEIVVSLEKGAGTVTLIDAAGEEHENFPHEDGLAGVVNAAIDAAGPAHAALESAV